MQYTFEVSQCAKQDLHDCRRSDRIAAATISTLLREIMDNPDSCKVLSDTTFYDETIESVEPFWKLQDRRINGFRVRLVDLGRWRLITVVDHLEKRLGLFAIMPRNENYSKALTERVEKECDELGFSRLGGR